MKLFLEYLKQQRIIFYICILFCLVFLFSILLYRLPVEVVIYPTVICIFLSVIISVAGFKAIKDKHSKLNRIKAISDIDESILPEALSIAEKDYSEIIRLMNDEHKHYCESVSREYSETVDYYTVWVHQIKTPIASMRLNLQNEDSELSRKLYGDLRRIEQYVEMVLTFLRLNSDSTDYVIKEYSLDKIIKQSVKKLSSDFIGKKISLVYEPIEDTVITDEKWLSFVIEQVISNALKYTAKGSITIAFENKVLSVTDTGIGIEKQDLPRIFENGYTGYNGRADKSSSGIGLYLCKRICSNLGHKIEAFSEIDKGTTIAINL